MMSPTLWAIGSDLPVKVLAVAGGVALGAFILGWLVQIIAAGFGQKVPAPVLAGVRVLGGVSLGLLVFFWVRGEGGFGGGGWGLGGGQGTGKGTGTEQISPRGDATGKTTGGQAGKGAGEPLTIEVLGDAPLQTLARRQGATPDLYRRYRVVRDGKKVLLTREEVEKYIGERRSGQGPALHHISLVIYKDSPSADQDWVTKLEDFVRPLDKPDNRLQVTQSKPSENAPLD